jgi:putative copper export protein
MQTIVYPIIRFLHDLFTAIWIGGLVLMVLVIIPALHKNLKMKEAKTAINHIQNRLQVLAIISMIMLAITGILLSNRSPLFTGLFSFGSKYMTVLSIKHILMFVMVFLALLRLGLIKKNQKAANQKLEKVSVLVLILNAVSGVVVLFLSAFLAAIK